MLERCAGKLARTVLRRGGGGNVSSLSDSNAPASPISFDNGIRRYSPEKTVPFCTDAPANPNRTIGTANSLLF
jgi:hypothetical protein